MIKAIRLSPLLTLISLIFYLPAALSSSQDREDQWLALVEKVDQLRIEKNIPGLAVSITSDNKLLGAKGFGFADNNREIPVTPDTPFWTASISKTFVGLAYLHLEAEEKVEFNELARETPKFIRLCDWLANTTIAFAERLDCKADITIENILHHQVNGTPGTEFMYNPIMYSRLSRHLEHKLGEGVDKVEGRHNYLGQSIDNYILKPAGMTRTMASMWDRSKMEIFFDLADGFETTESSSQIKLPRPDKHIAGGAGVVSTVLDLSKYDIAISKGTVASDEISKKLLRPAKFKNQDISPYGFGWYFQCYKGEKLMWHGGWDPDSGYSGLLLRLPERALSVAFLANSGGMWWGNPLNKAEVESSPFAKLFLDEFVFNNVISNKHSNCEL